MLLLHAPEYLTFCASTPISAAAFPRWRGLYHFGKILTDKAYQDANKWEDIARVSGFPLRRGHLGSQLTAAAGSDVCSSGNIPRARPTGAPASAASPVISEPERVLVI